MPVDLLVERFVVPYYLDMMGRSAIRAGGNLVADVGAAGRSMTDEDVVTLLRSDWRERAMGAWFALFHDGPAVRQALLRSLETSLGSLTSPALATVAVLLAGTDAVESLRRYRTADLSGRWGAASFIDATIEHLGSQPVPGSQESLADARNRATLSDMLAVAERLRSDALGEEVPAS